MFESIRIRVIKIVLRIIAVCIYRLVMISIDLSEKTLWSLCVRSVYVRMHMTLLLLTADITFTADVTLLLLRAAVVLYATFLI